MKRLHNLSIRKKFAIVIIPLLVTIIAFDYFQIKRNYLDYHDSARLNKAILMGIEINHVVHEIQKERGISAGYLSSGGTRFTEDLMDQRQKTDSTIRGFVEEIKNPELESLLAIHGEDLEYIQEYFGRIPELRTHVDNQALTSDQVIKYFTDLNASALTTVNDLINETRDRAVAQQVHAVIYFLKAKENSSIERAIGTEAFSKNRMGFEKYNQYTSLVSQQDAYLDAFLTISNQESIEYYERIVQGSEVEEVERLRDVLINNQTFNESPEYWLSMITTKINAMKKVEDYMSDRLYEYTNSIAMASNQRFWTFLIIDIAVGVFALWLLSVIVRRLLENVSILDEFTRKISAGDLTHKVSISDRDEIGHYADTFNVMIDDLNKTHDELKKERDHAEYLYENIYKQSEVVFENVQQGIFLLDKDFKISNLYSKAMEEIFENNKIAGENFANFMRPLIIPRDLEALEMFIMHLFNEDMDEDVVNQLNPVEQVKIFTETDGIVKTKYIRISFTRVEREGAIQSIMVTVSDETESVLLQQHLEETEARKKRETEQVLSILKIDPSVLRGFLHNSKKVLKSVSERYEKDKSQDYNSLMSFTFETIHGLKGNAMVIGLDLMSDKFHDIEDAISKLRDKTVSSKDFLSILYEIDEANKILDDMSDMLRKVANIYKKFPGEGQTASNVMFIDSLQKGLEKLSSEVDKPVDLTFENEQNIEIPEDYIATFNDTLIQLMRNSLAHGIEEQSERVASGKHVKGSIEISLEEQNGELVLKYKDDGQGLDSEKIVKRAVKQKFITKKEAEDITEDMVPELLFHNGFSTKDEADKHSGRGQGLSLVKRLIERQNGTFSVNHAEGRFFEMVIHFPHIESRKEEEIEIA